MDITTQSNLERPARLAAGARVALVAPAGPASEERVEAALAHSAALGFEAVLGEGARLRSGYLAGPDEARARDLQRAIDDPAIDAIWAIRGGYGTMRIVPDVDWTGMRRRPRPFIGFSDNTAVHLALLAEGLVSFHGPHAGAPFPPFTRTCFTNVLCAGWLGTLPVPAGCTTSAARGGVAEGPLVGGNLTLLAALCGTRHALRAEGRIVLIEDIGEPAYRVDRALTQLLLSGCFRGATGFALGQFTQPAPGESEEVLLDVCVERLAALGVPIVGGLPFGHVDEQWCLPLGVRARLDGGAGTLELLEPGVV